MKNIYKLLPVLAIGMILCFTSISNAQNATSAESYLQRGLDNQAKGNYDEAIRAFNKALELKPDDAYTYINRGVTYGIIGNLDQAIEDFDKTIELKPKYADAYNMRGLTYDKKGDYDQAIKDSSKAIQLKPDYADAYYTRGRAYYNKDNLDEAIRDYSEAIRLNPNYADAYDVRGLAYADKGNLDQSIRDCSKAIQLKPDNPYPYVNRGRAYNLKGNYDQAILDYNTAIKLKPDLALAHYNRGVTYENKGNLTQAILDFRKALKIDPTLQLAQNKLDLALSKQKTTPTQSTTSTSAAVTWEAYQINTHDILSTKRNGIGLIKFPITPNQTSNNSNNIRYEINYKESDLMIDATYFATFQPVVDEGRMVYDLLPENYGKIVINTIKSRKPEDKYNLISYKTLPLGMDETKFSFVNSDGKIVYARNRAIMRNRTLFQMLCKRIDSLDDVICDKFFKSFSFTYK